MQKTRIARIPVLLFLAAFQVGGAQGADGFIAIRLDSLGDAHVAASFYDLPSRASLSSRIAAALGCSLRDVHEDFNKEHSGFAYVYLKWNGSCVGLLRHQGLWVEGKADFGPLLRLARDIGVEHPSLSVWVRGNHADPDPPSGWRISSTGETTLYSFPDEFTGDATPLRLAYGYRQEALKPMAIVLAIMLLFPPALIWLLRGYTKRRLTDDKSAAFHFSIWLSLTLLAAWLFWMTAESAVGMGSFAMFLGGAALNGALARTLFFLAPPLLTIAVCTALAFPVLSTLQGPEWRRRDAVLEAVVANSVFLVPLALLFTGMFVTVESMPVGMAWLLGCYPAYLLLALASAKVGGFLPQALTHGELRDKIYALAARAGVSLTQIYILPVRKGRHPNAFAMKGRRVMISHELVDRFSRREVDAVMAHELGHLKGGHVSMPVMTLVFCIAFGYAMVSILKFFGMTHSWIGYVPLAPLAAILTANFLSRKFEYAADAKSVALTNDPEAMIGALAKLARMTKASLDWNGMHASFLTHPSMMRRFARIAQAGDIAMERLPAIVSGQESDPDRYSIPPSELSSEWIFSTRFKHAASNMLYATRLLALLAFPFLVAHLAENLMYSGWHGRWMLWLGAAGIPLSFLAVLALKGFSGMRVYRNLEPRVQAALEKRGASLLTETRAFVGMSPGWWPSRRLVVAWEDQETGGGGTLNLGAYNRRFAWQQMWVTRELRDRIEGWRLSARGVDCPCPIDALSSPQFGDVTSNSVNFVKFRNCLAPMAMLAGASLALGSMLNEPLAAYPMLVSPLLYLLVAAPNVWSRRSAAVV